MNIRPKCFELFSPNSKSLQEAGSRVPGGPALHRSLSMAPSASAVSPDSLGGLRRSFCRQHWGLKGRREKRGALLMPSLLSSGSKVLPKNGPADSRTSPWQELRHKVPPPPSPAAGERGRASLWHPVPRGTRLTWERSPGRSPHLRPWRTLTFVPSSGRPQVSAFGK